MKGQQHYNWIFLAVLFILVTTYLGGIYGYTIISASIPYSEIGKISWTDFFNPFSPKFPPRIFFQLMLARSDFLLAGIIVIALSFVLLAIIVDWAIRLIRGA